MVALALFAGTSVQAKQPESKTLNLKPATCEGWANSGAARKIDLSPSAPASAFSEKNAASFHHIPTRTGTFPSVSSNADLHCRSFNLERLASGGEVVAAALRLSLAAGGGPEGADVLAPAYSFDGVNWRTTETILVRGTMSNQTHEGYWQFPLPAGVRPDDLARLQVRLHYAADEDSFTPAQVFVDGLALELTVRPPPRRGFLRRLFSVREEPVILIDERTLKAVELLDADGQPVPVELTTTAVDGRTQVTIRQGQLVKPGNYILRTKSPRLFRTKVTEQRFSFGVASLNTPKSVYRPGDLVPLTMGAVDDRGRTACDAPLTLRIRKPDGRLVLNATSDHSIVASAECGPKSITNQPDYVAHIIADQPGTYQAELVLGTVQGAQTVTSTFEVASLPQPTIERLGPTRINPKARYVERLRITPTAPFRGLVEERVPAAFTISDPQPAAEVGTDGDSQTVRWTVDWKAGQTYDLAYTFDAPDVSPALYELGPFRLGEVTEPRTQTIAVDEVVQKEDPDVPYEALPVTDADFAPKQEELVETTKSTFTATENAHIKVFKSGFDVPDSQVPERLDAAKALSVEKVEVLGPGESPVETVRVSEAFSKDGRELEFLHLVPKRTFKPGLYTVKTTLTDGQQAVTETSTFAWGVVALNMQKSVFGPGETVAFGMATLDAVGNTVCEADLTLTVTPPQGPPVVFATSTGTIVRSPECGPITVTNVPDYGATATAGGSGDYGISLTATIKGQSYTITDTLRVQTDIPFDIARSAPTRVFPPAEYDFAFNVTPSADYQGSFEEFLPTTYRLVSIGQGGVEEARSKDTKAVKWTVDWKAGQTYSLTYRVDPEDISPALFLLGPAKVGAFTEFRQWQVASDALITVSGTVYTNEGTTAYDCLVTNLTINVRVNGAGTASGTCSAANGTYSVSSVSVAAAADVITTYVDANASVRAVVVTRAADATSNITGLDLYQNRVIVRHEDAGPITNTNLDQFDSGNDADVQFTVTTGALTVLSGQELHVWTGKSYSPGGTIATNTTGGDLHIASTATLTAGGAMTVGGSWNNEGTFTASSNTVTFNSTSTGKTVAGTLNGSSAFYKVALNGSGGDWTIQNSMLVNAANATDSFVVGNGTVTFGDSNGDTLQIDGKTTIANTAGQTGTFQTAALAEGSTVTIDINANTATPSCANCIVTVGATSGAGTGTLKIRKNAIWRLNPRSAATASDTGIEVESTGYLEIQGSQDDTGTSNGTTDETTLTDTTKSWTTNQHANKKVRITNTGSLAFGRIYTISSNTATALTRSDNSTANATVQSIVSDETQIKSFCASVNSLITADNEGIGRYVNDQTGTTGLLRIVSSTNNSTSCTGSTDFFVVAGTPGALSILAASDTLDIIDGVRANDTFEILDYANVTAENGTACGAAVNEAGEAYIYPKAGSETLIQYAEICNLGRNLTNKLGIEFTSVNGNNAGEGLLVNKSEVRYNYRGIRLISTSNNSSANTEGVTNTAVSNSTLYGIELNNSDNVYIANNRSYDNTSYGMLNDTGSDSNTWTGNYSYSNSNAGFYVRGVDNTISSNYSFENTTYNFYLCCSGRTITLDSNWAYGAATYGIYAETVNHSTFSNNTLVRNTYGIRLHSSSANNLVNNNTSIGNTSYGIYLSTSSDNNLIYSNTVIDNGFRGINLGNVIGTIIFSNTVSNNDTQTTQGTGMYLESNSGSGVDNTTYFNNAVNQEDIGFFVQYTVAANGTRFINEGYGTTTTNNRDIRFDSTGGAHEIAMYNTTLAAATEMHVAPSVSGAYIISRKHDAVNGAVRVWNDYTIPSNNAETPQTESTEQYNYANALWPDSVTPHTFRVGYGAGTEDTDLQLGFSGAMGGDGSVYAYRVVCTAANCVTTANSWDVYRSGTLLTAKASTGTTYTDSQNDGASAPNVQFTIQDAGTDYTAGATYTFTAYKGATDTNTQKTITMMQDADTFTVPSGTTLQLKGQSAGTNVTQATRGATGGYSFIINGAIDADAYSFNYLGGASQASGLDINSGATVTNLDNGSFDNFGTNVGTADSFIDIDSSLIGSSTPGTIIDNTTFTNTGSNANCAVNATGVDATGYIQFTGSTGAFGSETNDCNDGVADADPGQIKWGGIRIKGTAYSDEGSTAYNCSTDNLTINVSVNGGANTAYTCTAAGGTYTIAASAPAAAADPIVISIDSVEIPDATTATLAASTTAAIAGLDLYQNRLVVRHENAGPMTNAKLSTGDNADAGIRYAVSAGALTVESGIELHVWNSKTFTPGGTVTTQGTGDLHVDDSATATLDTATSAIARDITVDTGSTLNINATTTVGGGDITTGGTGIVATSGTPTVTIRGTGNIGGGSGAITFYALTVGDATTATSTATSSFTVNNTLTVGTSSTLSINSGITVTSGTAGTVTINGTISGAGTLIVQNSNLGTGGTLSSVVRFDATSGDITMPNRTYGGNVDVYSNYSLAARIVTMAAGTHTLSAALSLNAANSQNVTLAGATNNPTVNLTGNLTYTNGGAGTEVITSGTGTWTASGNVDFSNGTYTAASGNTLVMNGASRTLTSNGQTLQNLTLSGSITLANATHTVASALDMTGGTITSGTSTAVMTGTANLTGGGQTLNNLTVNGSGNTVTLTGSDLTVSGALTLGAAADANNDTLTLASGRTLTLSGNTGTTLDITASGTDTINGPGRLTYRNAATTFPTAGTLAATLIVRFDTLNGNMTIPARTDYGVVEAFGDSANARTITLAAGTITTSGNFLVMAEAASPNNVTVAGATNNPTVNIGGSLDFTGAGTASEVITSGTGTWTVSGNFDVTGGTFTHNNGTVTLTATDTGNTINPGSSSLYNVTLNGSGGEWSALTNTLTVANDLLVVAGTLNTASGSANITVNGNVQCSGTCGTINLTAAGHTFTHSVAASKSFGTNVAVATDWTFYNLTFTGASGSPTVTLNGTGTGAINVTNNLTLTNSGTALIVNNETNDRVLDVNNDVVIGAGTTLQASSTAAFRVGSSWSNSGTFTSGTGTVTLDAASGTKTIDTNDADSIAGADFHHLTLNDGGGTATFRPVYTLDVNGNLTNTGGTLDMTGPTAWYLTNDGGGTAFQRLLKPTDPAGTADNTADCSDSAVQVSGYCVILPRASSATWVGSLPSAIQQRGYMFNDGMVISGSFAAGTWSASVTTNIVEGAYTYATRQVCGKLWKADAALTSGTIIKDWTCATIAGVGVQDTTIAFGSLAAQTLSSQVVYAEFAVRLTGGIENTSGATTVTFRVNEGGAKQKLTTPAFTPHLLLGGNWTNSDLFTHASGTVVLDGSAQQTVGSGATSFSGLTVTNSSGSDPVSSPSVIFSGAATAAGTFSAETASTKLRLNAGSTYTFQNIAFNGQATSTRVALRSSTTGTAWNLNVAGTRTVSNTDVRDSNACGQAPNIDASDGTNFDAGGNSCWEMNTLTFAVSDTSIGFGSVSASSARWANGGGTGSASDASAHTLQITTNARNGYAITYNGATLTSGSNTISAATITDDADGTPGSEQFAIGFETNGNATIASGYDHNATAALRDWNFVPSTTTTIISETGATAIETISAFYLTNIASVTEAGSYSTAITYIATATF